VLPGTVIGPADFRDLPRLPSGCAVTPAAQIVGRTPGRTESGYGLLLGPVGCGHRACGGIGRAADQLLDDTIGGEGARRKDMGKGGVLTGLLDDQIGAAPIEDDGDAPALGVMQCAQCLRKLGPCGVLVACGRCAQVRPGMEDVGAIDQEMFFKSHGVSLSCTRKLDKPSLRQSYGLAGRIV
jgi:hypothetical protein